MIKILNINHLEENLGLERTWIIEVLGQRKDDILILKDLFEDHDGYCGLHFKGIKFNTGFPSFSEIGAKLFIRDFSTLNAEESKKGIFKILDSLIS